MKSSSVKLHSAIIDVCIQWVLDDDKESICDSSTMTRQDAKFLRYFYVKSKQELLDIFRNYISMTNKDSTNKTMFNINLSNKKVSFVPLNDTAKQNKAIPVVKDNATTISTGSAEILPSTSALQDSATANMEDTTHLPSTDATSDESKASENDISENASVCSNEDDIDDFL